ncbi:MAG: T9SS type A sorting domain-containing protein [Cyclobacteriaceae bacterium]
MKRLFNRKKGTYMLLIILIINAPQFSSFARELYRELIKNIEFIAATAVNKYDWNDPASKFMILENVNGDLTSNEIKGLKQYALNAWLPTHNDFNYYFRKRMNSYMIEWLYKTDKDIDLLNRAITIARRAVAYRNDNICNVNDLYTCYQISYDRSIAPVWPNYKELEIYEDGTHGLAPGASGFAGLPMITIPVRMIAENSNIWSLEFEGKSYRDIANELAGEAQKTIDYTYDVFVGDDHLIRYPSTMQRTEWHGNVYIYNRVFPVMSGAIPLLESYEIFETHQDKIEEIDRVNQAMIDYLIDDMTFFQVNGKECVRYPYSDEAQEKNPDQAEDFTHGSFDSRDFQLFYKSGRYDFDERYVNAMANTLVEVLDNGDGTFKERLNGSGNVTKGTPISYDGYVWYASYRPEVYKIIVNHILEKNIAKKGDTYDAYCLFEILKLKEHRGNNPILSIIEKLSSEVKIYPNPAYESFELLYDSPSFQKLNLQLYDTSGLVLMDRYEAVKKGKNQLRVGLDQNIENGMYILKVSTINDKNILRKLVIKR